MRRCHDHEPRHPARPQGSGALPQPRAGAARIQFPRAGAGAGCRACRCSSGCAILCISCTNLDEFFEVRVAMLQAHSRARRARPGPDGAGAERRARAHPRARADAGQRAIRILERDAAAGARARRHPLLASATRGRSSRSAGCRAISSNEVLPVLSPLGLDPAHPFPRILNKSLNFAVVAARARDAFGREGHMALVRAPRSLPRIIRLPAEVARGAVRFRVPVEHPACSSSTSCFPGMRGQGRRTSSASPATASCSSTRKKSRTSRSR